MGHSFQPLTALIHSVPGTFEGALGVSGLPASIVDKTTGGIMDGPRGCETSGALQLIAEAAPEVATSRGWCG